MKHLVEQLWDDHAEWSQKTFGTDAERGPSGPLKHLCAEAEEALAAPKDGLEYADCLLLVFDAARRAGFGLHELLACALGKLQQNKRRQWPAAKPDEPVMHVKEDGRGEPR